MILVTGASGLNGSSIIREFVRHRTPVRALVRRRAMAVGLEPLPNVEIIEGDMSRPETLGAAFRDVERALLISSANSLMVETQCAFIHAARTSGVQHIVKFSGKESNIDFNPINFRFTRMHQEIERYLETSGLQWTHLRPSQFMQVYLREIPTIIRRSSLLLPLDGVQLSPVDVDDIAKVAYAVLTGPGHEGKIYEMTGPEALTMADVAERISEAIGKTVRYTNITDSARNQALLNAGMSPEFVDALAEQANERRRHPASRVFLGTHQAFGIHATTFAEFVGRTAWAFRGEQATAARAW